MKPSKTLVCRASNKGVLIIGKKGNTFFPKQEKVRAFRGEETEDERFVRYCLSGVKRLSPWELDRLSPDQVRRIDNLNKKALRTMLRMKGDIAYHWSKNLLKPLMRKNTGANRMVPYLIIDDIRKVQLDMGIPRPFLINELLKLKDHAY